MNKAFEKILERLDVPQFDMGCEGCLYIETCDIVQEHITNEKTDLCAETMRTIAKSIVQEVAEEYLTDTSVWNNGWIPCSERLPEENQKVMLQDSYENITIETMKIKNGINGFVDGDWWTSANNYIAWQPLPEPYKESEG